MRQEKVLFISQRIPYPPNKGCKIRSFHIVEFLHKKYVVDIVTFIDDPYDKKYCDKLHTYCNKLHVFYIIKFISFIKGFFFLLIGKSLSEGYYHSRKVKNTVSKLINQNNYKFVFCFSSQTAQFVMDKDVYRLIDFCDVDSDKFKQYGHKKPFPLNWLYYLESKRLAYFESIIHNNFNKSIFITQKEVNLFLETVSSNNYQKIHVMGNGVDYDYFTPKQKREKKEEAIMFSGEMSDDANVESIMWFYHNVFIKLLKMKPYLKFYIVGRNPAKKITKLQNDNIVVTGRIPDVRPYFERASIAVIPLRIARGVQNKILEAMSMETPVVISETLYSTLNNINKKDIFIYNTEETLINIILNSIDKPKLLQKRGKEHRKYVVDNLNWGSVIGNSSVWGDL